MEETIMADKAYEYMDWPRIEAIVYGEEASPRDVMQKGITFGDEFGAYFVLLFS